MNKERENLSVRVGELIRAGEVEEVKRILETVEGDLMVYEDIEALRSGVEPIEGWIRTKESVDKEFEQLQPVVLKQLIQRAKPFIEALPAGHSKGHFVRDAIHLSMILGDPSYQEIDRVELLSGIFAGVFHDIGNAVVERYHDSVRFAAHAEVGAYTFRELAKGILPPNISKLTELSISGHTGYQSTIEILRDGKMVERQPYENEIIDGNRVAMWITRQADKLDGRDITWLARKIIVSYRPIVDFSWEMGFATVGPSEEADFSHQFGIKRRPRGYLASLDKESLERESNILERIVEQRRTVFEKDSPYAQYDSEYFTWVLMPPKVSRDTQFILAVEGNPPSYTQEDREGRIDRFLQVCKILEPAQDIDEVTETLRHKFFQLPIEHQNKWAHGFEVYTSLYKRWYTETEELLRETPVVADPKLQEIINNLHKIAVRTLPLFDSAQLEG